jgi:hypothetical protein
MSETKSIMNDSSTEISEPILVITKPFPSTTFVKVFRNDMTHHGFTYKPGEINYLDKPFEKEGVCSIGGLYFTTLEYIGRFFPYGDHIRIVTLPTDIKDFQMVQDPTRDKYRANMIFVDKTKYPLNELQTYINFNLVQYVIAISKLKEYLQLII